MFATLLLASVFLPFDAPAESEIWQLQNHCATIAVWQCLAYCEKPESLENLAAEFAASDQQLVSLHAVATALERRKVATEAVRFRADAAYLPNVPMILALHPTHNNTFHFVFVPFSQPPFAYVIDGERGGKWVANNELHRIWDGEALIVGKLAEKNLPAISIALYSAMGVVGVSMAYRFARRKPIVDCTAIVVAAAIGTSGCGNSNTANTNDQVRPAIQVSPSNSVTIRGSKRGDLNWGQAEFLLVNDKLEAVKILGVRKSCSCASVELSAKEIAPGGTVRVTVALESAMHIPRSATLSIDTDDRSQRTIGLSAVLLAEVSPPLILSPNAGAITSINLNEDGSAELGVATIETVSKDGSIAKVVSSSNSVQVELDPKRALEESVPGDLAQRGYMLLFKADPMRHLKNEAIDVLFVNRVGGAIGRRTFELTTVPEIQFIPSMLSAFSPAGQEKVVRRTALIRCSSASARERKIQLTAPSNNPEWLALNLQFDSKKGSGRIDFDFQPAAMHARSERWVCRIATSLTSTPVIELPVELSK